MLEQTLEHVNGRVERAAGRAVLLLAVPAAIGHLFAEQPIDHGLDVDAVVRANRHHAPVDARLRLTGEYRRATPGAVGVVPHSVVTDEADSALGFRALWVEAHLAQMEQREQRDPLRLGLVLEPVAVRTLEREKLRAPALGGHAGSLAGDLVGGCIGQIAHRLPPNGGVSVEQPIERVHVVIMELEHAKPTALTCRDAVL